MTIPWFTAKNEDDWQKQIADWPPSVREVASRYGAYKCWRSKVNREFHYAIMTYSVNPATHEVRLTLVHAHGTRRAGVVTFGQPYEQLLPCNCGGWEPPTEEDKATVRERLGLPTDGPTCDGPWRPPRLSKKEEDSCHNPTSRMSRILARKSKKPSRPS